MSTHYVHTSPCNASPLEQNPTAEQEIEPGTLCSVGNDNTSELIGWIIHNGRNSPKRARGYQTNADLMSSFPKTEVNDHPTSCDLWPARRVVQAVMTSILPPAIKSVSYPIVWLQSIMPDTAWPQSRDGTGHTCHGLFHYIITIKVRIRKRLHFRDQELIRQSEKLQHNAVKTACLCGRAYNIITIIIITRKAMA